MVQQQEVVAPQQQPKFALLVPGYPFWVVRWSNGPAGRQVPQGHQVFFAGLAQAGNGPSGCWNALAGSNPNISHHCMNPSCVRAAVR